MGRSSAEVTHKERQQSVRFIALATAGAVVYSVSLPLLHLYGIAADPTDRSRTIYAAAATACFLPVQVWLVVSATRGANGWVRGWALAAMAAVIIGMLPVVGVAWFGNLYLPAALVLVMIRPPWSFFLYAALVAAPTPVTFALDHPEWATYYTIGMLYTVLPLAVVIWFIRTARQLQSARLALAEEAIVRERLRIDGDLRTTVGAGLEAIAAMGDLAGGLAASDPRATVQEVRTLVGTARRTLADARLLITRYREVSLRAELETAATLLSAAGFPTQLSLPPGDLPDSIDERQRATLQGDIARLLASPSEGAITIGVVNRNGRIEVELLSVIEPTETTKVSIG